MAKKASRVRIRLTTHRDAAKFLKLEARCFEMEPNRDTIYFWTPVVEYLWAYKAVVGKKIVGGIIAIPTRKGDWYVNSLFVHPMYRGIGIASLLLGGFLVRIKDARVLLDVKTDRPYLVEFYGKFGFRKRKRMANYYDDGTDRFLLVRDAPYGGSHS